MSVIMRCADWLLHRVPSPYRDFDKARAAGDKPRVAAQPGWADTRRWNITPSTMAGRPLTTLSPRAAAGDVTLIYLHGGAYVNEMLFVHWAIVRHMTRGTGATVIVPSYGLAPEHTVDETYGLIEAVVRDVRDRHPGGRIYLAGDSAGGGLALGFALEHRTDELRVDGLFLISPWVDATMTNPDARTMEPVDGLLGVDGLRYWGEKWAGSRPVTDERVSPGLAADLSGLPPTRVYQGGRDLFLPDVQKFTRAAQAAGSPVVTKVFADGFHVFPALTFAPEARTVFRDVQHVLGTT